MRFDTLTLAFVLGALAAGKAVAEEPQKESVAEATSSPEPAKPAQLDDPAALYYEAEAKYAAGDVEGALQSMQRSFELSRRSELLFNLGELHRELSHCDAARLSYEQYLKDVESARFRDRATAALTSLDLVCSPARVPAKSRPPAPPPPLALPKARYWTGPRVVAWSMLGAGIAAGAFSTYFMLEARDAESDVERAVASNQRRPLTERLPWEELGESRYAQGQRASTLAYVFGAGAVAFAVSGAGLLLTSSAKGPAEPSRPSVPATSAVSIAVSPEEVRGAWSFAF